MQICSVDVSAALPALLSRVRFSKRRAFAGRCSMILLAILCIQLATSLQADDAVSPSPTLARLDLTDYRGKQWSLQELADKPVVVIAFLGVECPLAKLYSTRLNELQKQFGDEQVAIIGVDANPQDALSELAAFARRQQIDYPLLCDSKQEVASQLGATRTPEVFVLDRQRRVRYQGRIDDQYGIGYVRKAPQQQLLREAVEGLLAGRELTVSREPAVGCLIGKAKRPTTSQEITYSKDIAPIFRDACVQCHREGEIGPFAMTDYAEVSGWAEMIAEVVAEKRMPPWHADSTYGSFANDCSLSDAQRELVLQWVAAGAPEGNPADLPEPRHYVDGWQLPKQPDLVLNVSPEPIKVPATGEVKYQYKLVDPDFKEDKWVTAAQIIPGNRSVVHHILVFARPKGQREGLAGERGFLFGYVPGSIAQPYPAGTAKRIPAGSELIFQIHYTPIGTPQTDQSKLGLVFVEPSQVEREVKTTSAVQTSLNIPPGDDNYTVKARLESGLPNCELLGMAPHMHLRGKSFRYTLLQADKSTQVLLNIPRYDFNWQTAYRLTEPLKITSGSTILCEAAFDNSAKNLNNPDPTARVHWGDQTTDEMMIGYFDVLVPKTTGEETADSRELRRVLIQRILRDGLVEKLDKNGNGSIERSEIPNRWKSQFNLLDINRDDKVTSDELKELD